MHVCAILYFNIWSIFSLLNDFLVLLIKSGITLHLFINILFHSKIWHKEEVKLNSHSLQYAKDTYTKVFVKEASCLCFLSARYSNMLHRDIIQLYLRAYDDFRLQWSIVFDDFWWYSTVRVLDLMCSVLDVWDSKHSWRQTQTVYTDRAKATRQLTTHSLASDQPSCTKWGDMSLRSEGLLYPSLFLIPPSYYFLGQRMVFPTNLSW